MVWNTIYEKPNEDIAEKAREILRDGRSLLILGPPGVGKSTLTKRLVAELRKSENVKTVALTHVASRNIEGMTVSSFIHRYIWNGSFQGTLVIDEISVLPVNVLNAISVLLCGKVRFILLGDFFQLPAICDFWAGRELKENGFENGRLLWELCGGNVIHMTQCRRSAGTHLFHFITGLYPSGALGHLALPDQVALAKKVFPRQPGHARWNLVISHAKRKIINKVCYFANATGERRAVHYADELVEEIYVGCPLIGNTTAKNITNGVFYECQGFNDTHLTLLETESGEQLDVPVEHAKFLRISFAITLAAIQGRTLHGLTRCWDCDNKNFSSKHLAMAVGRVTRPEDLDFA